MIKECQICGKDFIAYGHRKKTGKFCSIFCKGQSQVGIPGYWTGKKRPPRTDEERRKISEGLRGHKAHSWKGGITPIVQKVRHCYKYKQWRTSVFERDNYTCVFCSKRGGDLNADHHPKLFSQIMVDNEIRNLEKAMVCDELWDIKNGRTLCEPCHFETFKFIYA